MPRSPFQPAPIDPNADSSQRNWSQWTHLVGLLSAFPWVTFVGLIGTAGLWLVRRNQSEFIDDHGREALNFQISILLYSSAGTLASMFAGGSVGALAAVAVGALTIYGGIRGATAAGRGEYFRYPMCLRFIHDGDEILGRRAARHAAPY
mgnify:CR=1 FL=1